MIGKAIQTHGGRYKRRLGRALRDATGQGMRRIWAQIVQTSGARIYGLVVGMIALSVTARYLGPGGRGIVAAARGWVAMFSTFGSLSLGQVIIHLAAGRKRADWLPATLGTLLVIIAIVTVLGWGIAAIGYVVTGGEMFNHLTSVALVLAFVTLPLLLGIENGKYILLALDSLQALNVARVIGNSLNIASILVLVVYLGWGINGALVASAISQLVIASIMLASALKQAKRVHATWGIAKQLLSGGMKLHFNAIGTFLFTQANVVIMNHFRPPEETGYYQLAVQLISVLQVVSISANMVIYTVITKKGPDQAWPEHRRLLGQSLFLILIIMIAGYWLSPFGITLLAGDEFISAVPLFRMLLLALPGMTFSTIMSSQWIGRGLFLQAASITLFVGILNVIGNYAVIPRHGMFGAVWVTVLTYMVSVLGNGIMALWVETKWRKSRSNHD